MWGVFWLCMNLLAMARGIAVDLHPAAIAANAFVAGALFVMVVMQRLGRI